MISLSSPLAVVAHDAGATNLIIGWLKDRPDLALQTCLGGPAIGLWAAAFPRWKSASLNDALSGAKALLSGTSWPSDLEYESRRLAQELGVPSVGVIDHWVNYRMRFIRNEHLILPDEIWVSDEIACSMALQCFPGHFVRQLPNRYLERLVDKVNASSKNREAKDNPHVLYVLEPIREQWGDDAIAGEFQALDFFIEKLSLLGLGEDVEIRLRPHPSDPPDKYNHWCEVHEGLNISIDTANILPDLIAWADWVVGCETFAMVIALHANRRTLSTLPTWAPCCKLPQKEIIQLRDL